MHFTKNSYSVSELVDAYNRGSLVRNAEYQRGAAWRLQQQQALVDSIFREYPIPPLFLEKKVMQGLGGSQTEHFEIIDGQQRILALSKYLNDDFTLLKSRDDNLRLPLSLRQAEKPWGGKRYSELPDNLAQILGSNKIDVYLVEDTQNPDEIRDLFIRLQSGTALTRQQIRDAWPGALGPKIEAWAGKLAKRPKYEFFTAVDGRSTRDEEDDTNDPYMKHRTTCAQLAALLLKRAQNPFAAPSIKAADLDGLYHEYTTPPPSATNLFDSVEDIFDSIEEVIGRVAKKPKGRRKVPKPSLLALAMFLQDIHADPNFKLTTEAKEQLAKATSDPDVQLNPKASSGGVIKNNYDLWREALPSGIGIRLDPKRLFDDNDKAIIRRRQEKAPDGNAKCALCGEAVLPGDEEFDHFPLPYRVGGRTVPDNGRIVHKEDHERGRPREEDQ